MTTLTHAGSRRMYSWWWDSHISPKNSKWLQENLTDMDSKVKQMIKLIEEDADSFARRAEMYYKKRPELMKLVEEFYRAYRALAERYDHATGVIRHAHRTMAEAFPNQIPMMLTDDLPAVSSKETEPHTPEKSHPSHAFLDPDESQKGASTHFHAIKRNGAYAEEPDSAICKTGSKQLSDLFVPGERVNLEKHAEGRARRGLSFLEAQEESELINGSYENRVQVLSESECVAKAETDIFNLKKVIAKLEIEKEAGLLQYQQSLERLRNLEFEVSSARDYSQRLDERARKAESEVEALKEALTKLQADREASFLQYQECLEKISNLEKRISFAQKDAGELNERATRAETQAESLKWDLAEVEAEKEAAVVQHKQCLETLSKLEKRLEEAEENARRIDEQAKIAENEIEALKLEVTKLTEEKEDATLRYQQCLEIISSLEHNLSLAEEEVRRLKSEIDDQVEKLNSSEQKCLLLETSNQTLQSDLQSFTQNMASQSEEHSEKQKGLGRLWNCIQEERLRFIEAETAFQTLQDLHSQSQEELRSLAADLHSKVEILGNVESRKQVLEDEVNRVKEENKILNELKLSSSLSIKNLQDEISNLRETIEMFEQEVGLRIDERNALQHEIYCLKEELNDLNRKNQAMMEEVRSTDLDPQCFVSSVKKLQDENSKLKETCKANEDEKAALLVKLEAIEKLLEKNSVLENSLCDLNAELDSVRGKVHELEETCQSLLLEKSTFAAEKATLFSELQTTTEMLEKLSEQNKLLENSLFDVNAELEGLRGKLKILEDTCHSLDHDKSSIFLEKETLVSQLNATHQTLKDLKKQHGELGEKHLELKGERESALKKVEELLVSLYCEREEHSRVVKLNEDELAEKDLQIQILQEDANCRKKDYEEEMNRALHSEIENFILQKCIRDMEKKNFSLLVDCQRLIDSSKMSDRMISILETENIQKQADVNSLSEKIRILRIGLLQVLKTLDTDVEELCGDMLEEDQVLLSCIHRKIQERQKSFDTIFNEKQKMAIENSVLVAFLEQLKQKVENLVTEKGGIEEEFRIQSKQFLALQIEVQKILEKNQGLKSMLSKGEERMEEMSFEIDNLRKQLTDLEKSRNDILEENCQIFEEKNLLMKRFVDLGIEKSDLEEEICAVIHDMMAQSHISLIFQNIILEKLLELKELGEDLAKLRSVNNDLEERLRAMVQKLENSEFDNSHLKESLIKLHVELNLAESINDQLICEIKDEREMLCQKKNKLLKAAEMFQALHAEKTEFQRMVEDLKIKYNEAMGKLEEQTNQNFFFSVDKDRQNEQLRCLCEVNQNLECETRQLHQELREAKLKEQKLSDEVHKGANEIEQWEIQASTLYAELQISAVNETLFEGKVSEVVAAFENLEHRHYSKDMESEQLKERVSDLQVENGKLSNKLAAYVPAVSALNDCITSLEMQTLVQEKPHDFEESKVENLVNQQNTENGRQNGEDQTVIRPDALPDFQDMQRRINAVAMAVKELNGRFKPKDEMREIQANKHVTLVDEANGNQHGLTNEQKKGKSRDDIPPVSEIEVLPKDIMLDHISECSSYGISRREALEAKDQMLELWETDDKDGIIDLQIDQAQKTTDAGLGDNHQRGATEEPNNKYSSFESLVEKELSVVDKLEISRRLTQPHEGGNKSKILERLGSDAQKLTNLQITIQDLMKKVEATEKSTKGKGGEYNMVKRQLEAAQDTVTKLFDANRELMKSVEEGTLSSVGKPAVESEDSGSVSRRRIAEHAGRGSEKTGQLQLEVQRLQFLLLKLDDGKERKKKSRMGDRSPRVLLRDYLYGGRTNYQKKKKMPFCACVTPPTKGD